MEKIILSGSAIIENDKLLLIYKKNQDHYEFPGGKVEENETLEEAAIRETKEEIGCEIEIIKYLGYIDFTINNKEFRSHNFLSKIKNNQEPKIIEKDKFNNMIWLDLNEYNNNSNQIKLAPNVKGFITTLK